MQPIYLFLFLIPTLVALGVIISLPFRRDNYLRPYRRAKGMKEADAPTGAKEAVLPALTALAIFLIYLFTAYGGWESLKQAFVG